MASRDQSPLEPLEQGRAFVFSCHKQVPCFNQCCQDLNQFLTPYDILRLKNFFHLSSSEFLEQYTKSHTGPQTGLPIVSLTPGTKLICPFVSQNGCMVYPDRPGSCRTYPLVRLASRDRTTGKKTERYFLLSEPHCLGFETGKKWTAEKWVKNQGLLPYNENNDLFMDLIAAKNAANTGPLDLKGQQIFRLACYDLDRFCERLQKGTLWGLDNIDSEILDKILKNEISVLQFAVKWAAYALFNAPLDIAEINL